MLDGGYFDLPERLRRIIHLIPETGCWWPETLWTSLEGYARIRWLGKCCQLHILVYVLLRGPYAKGLVLDHSCKQRLCCNPDHLEPVTQKENVARGLAQLFKRRAEYVTPVVVVEQLADDLVPGNW